jgi:prepilin-type N-terminal cleavage/methylation domain-containing protein
LPERRLKIELEVKRSIMTKSCSSQRASLFAASCLNDRSRKSRAGYTLLEVSIVVAIIALATSLAIQGYNAHYKNKATSSGAQKMAMALNTARYYAQAHQFSYRVTIDNVEREFWVDKVGTTPADETNPYPSTLLIPDPVGGGMLSVGEPKVVRPEKIPTDVIIAEARNVQTHQSGGLDLTFIIFRADGSARSSAVLQFLNLRDDPNDPANYHTVRVEAPHGKRSPLRERAALRALRLGAFSSPARWPLGASRGRVFRWWRFWRAC